MKFKKILTIMLATSLIATSTVTAFAAEGEPLATTPNDVGLEEVLPENPTTGEIDTVLGEVEINNGSIQTVSGDVGTNNGSIFHVTPYGEVDINNGTIEYTAPGSSVNSNTGTINTLDGNLNENTGLIKSVGENGAVTLNSGEIHNNSGNVTQSENGSISVNEGHVSGGSLSINLSDGTYENLTNTPQQAWKVYFNSTILSLGLNETVDVTPADIFEAVGLLNNSAIGRIEYQDGSGYNWLLQTATTNVISKDSSKAVDTLEVESGNAQITKLADGTYSISNLTADTFFRIAFKDAPAPIHKDPEEIKNLVNDTNVLISFDDADVVYDTTSNTVVAVAPVAPVEFETYETAVVKNSDIVTSTTASENAALGVTLSDTLTNASRKEVKDQIAYALSQVLTNDEFKGLDVTKAQVLSSSEVVATKAGEITFNLKGQKLTAADTVLVVVTDATGKRIVTKAVVNADGTITFNIPSIKCTLSLIKL